MAEAIRRTRVVVVDDSRLHLEIARDALASRAEVECCATAEEALTALRRAPADLVLSDLTMPGLSGLELLERVQREHPGTDFVLLTGNASVDSAVEALRMGATDYLVKPADADQLVLVLERTMARRSLLAENQRLRDERAILESCKSLTACLEPEDVYSVALDLSLHAVRREQGLAIYYRSSMPSTGGLHLRGFSDEREAHVRDALTSGKPLDAEGFEETTVVDRGPLHDLLRDAGVDVGPMLVLPMAGAESERGLICIPDAGSGFDDGDLERAAIVSAHAAVALQNAERYARARERAFLDDVTEIYNARYLLEAVDREIRRAERYGSELSILFLDLDRFKQVNDRHGHLVGSRALRQLSQLLGQCVRQVDTLARYGGDEFTIVLVDTGERVARSIAERIRSQVAESPFEAGPDEVMKLTCSVGISTYPTHGRTREALLDAADKAMYRAKSNGRDRVCSASELD